MQRQARQANEGTQANEGMPFDFVDASTVDDACPSSLTYGMQKQARQSNEGMHCDFVDASTVQDAFPPSLKSS